MTQSINVARNSDHNIDTLEDIKETSSIFERSQVVEMNELDDAPYKGLNPYDEDDHSIFFGRKNDIQKVVNSLLAWSLTILYGKSGVGKSSLLRAGVTHILNEKARENIADFGVPKLAVVVFPLGEYDLNLIPLDSADNLPQEGKSLVIVAKIDNFYHVRIFDRNEEKIIDKGKNEFLPDQKLVQQLEQAFSTQSINRQTKNELIRKITASLDYTLEESFDWQDNPLTGLMQQIEATISRSGWNIESPEPGLSFFDTLKTWTEALGGEEKNGQLFIILDQFEEYFLYHSLEDRQKKQEKFAVEFARAVNSDLPVNFLISIRDDSFAQSDRFRRDIPDLFEHTLEIKHLDRKSAYQAIAEPIKTYNKQVQSNKSVEIKPELIKSVLEGVSQLVTTKNGRAGTKDPNIEIEAPYLQLVMTRLWEEMDPTSRCLDLELLMNFADRRFRANQNKKIKSAVKRISREHLDTALEQLSDHKKDILSNIFQYLVTPSETKYAYSLYDLAKIYVDEYGGELEGTKSELTILLENLASGEQRIVRPVAPLANKQAEGKRFEIFHDVLAQPILDWRRRYLARKQREQEREQEKQLRIRSIKQGLAAQSLRQQRRRQDEPAALLACQAYHFNQQDQLHVLNQVDDALRQALSAPYFSNILKHHEFAFSSIAFSPDGKKLAAGSWDGNIYLWNQEKHYSECKPLAVHEKGINKEGTNEIGINAIAFSPDGEWLVSGSRDQTVRLWDLRQKKLDSKKIGNHQNDVTSVAFSPDGSLLASGSKDGTVKLWKNWQHSEQRPIILKSYDSKGQMVAVRSLTFSPNNSTLAVGCENAAIWLWNVQEPAQTPNKEPIVRRKHDNKIRSVAFSPDGKILVSASDDYTILLWDMNQPQEQPDILQDPKQTTKAKVRSVAFSFDGKMLASASNDQTIRLWKTDKLEEAPQILRGHTFNITSVAFSPDNQYLASCGWDNTVRLWDLNPPIAKPKILPRHRKTVRAIAISPEYHHDHLLASGSEDGTVRVWNLNQPDAEPKTFKGCGKVFGVALFISSDRQVQLLAAGSDDNIVRLWDLQQPSDKQPKQLKGHQDGVSSVAFSPDGRWLVSGSWKKDATVRLWDLQHPKPTSKILWKHENSVTLVAFSQDGQMLASGSDDKTIKLLDLPRNEGLSWESVYEKSSSESPKNTFVEPIVLKDHNARVWSIAFSPNGQYLASASDDWTVRLWKNLDSKNPVHVTLKGHSAWVNSVVFSPDGKVLASGSFDRTIRLWQIDQINWKAGRIDEAPIVLEDHNQSVSSVAFTLEGKYLVSGSYDNTIRLWIAKTKDLADMVCQKVLRNLTRQEWQQFMGDDITYELTCPNLPPGE
ncbi:MAG: hypothetical protein QNJ55_14210 [Xenococcus sp. MO_188.B8]|nr:hypothetical protein [Xenococcus sp. MO_188.B8]